MSRTVDERIVSMEFDNKRFESNVKTTLGTIDRLKQSLNFKGVSKGFDELNSSANKVNMNGMSNAVETIHAKFSALQVVGVTALANITNSAVTAGERMIKALTIDPVKTGLQEYETQINAIQTIMANTSSKGTTMDQVKSALNELNHYADMTIYNFSEMTRNIGTFTAAGVGLETSVSAIKGIANLAAVSGSNSQQASTAMYQLSQALATGTVKLMDWNSVVNAGMGGQVFQDALKETARVHGIAIDQIISDEGSFRDSLSKGWLTSDILTETLSKFTGDLNEDQLRTMGYAEDQIQSIMKLGQTANDAATKVKTFTQLVSTLKEAAQSGWTKTWELIIGDFDEAKELWTGISDFIGGIIGKSADARNNLLEGALSSKWSKFNDEIKKAGVSTEDFQEKLKETAKEHNIAIDDMIIEYGSLEKAIRSGKISTDVIVETLKKFAGTGETAAGVTSDMTDKLSYFQKVVGDVWSGNYQNGEDRIKALTDAGYNYSEVQELVNKTVDGHTLSLEDLSDAQLKSVGYTDEQITAIQKLAKEAEKTGTPINKLIDDITKPTGRELVIDTISNAVKPLIQLCGSLQTAWRDAFPPMTSDHLYNIIELIHGFSESLAFSDDTVDKITRTLKGVFAVLDLISTLMGGALRIGFTILQEFLRALGFVDVGILTITAYIGDAIVAFRNWFEQHNLINGAIRIGVSFVVKFADAVGKLLTSLYKLPVVQKGLSKIGDSFEDLFATIEKYLGGALKNLTKFIDELDDMSSIDLGNIGTSLKEFFNLDGVSGNIMIGFAKGLTDGAVNVVDTICNIGKSLIKAICTVLGIHSPSTEFVHVGSNIIAGLCEGLASGLSALIKSMGDVGNTILSVFKGIDFGTVFVMGSVIGLGVILWKLMNIMDKFSTPFEGLGKVFGGVQNVLGSFSKLIDAKSLEIKSKALLNIAKAIGILAASLTILSLLDQPSLWSAVTALSVLTIGMIALLKVTDKMNNMTGFGKLAVLMLGVSASLLLLSFAIEKLASIDADKSAVAMLEIAALIGGLTLVLAAYGKFIKGNAAKNINDAGKMFLKMAVGITILVFVIKLIAGIPNEDIVKGLIVIASMELLFAGIMTVSKLAGKNGASAGSMILKMSIAIGILAITIKLIGTMSISDIAKGLLVIAGIGVIFSGLVIVSKLAGTNASKAGTMFLKMSVAVGILALAIKLIAGISASDIVKGLATIAGIEILFGAFIILSNFAGVNASKAGSMLMKMSVAIGILALTMKLIGTLSAGDIAKGLLVIAGLEILFAGIIGVSMFAGRNAAQAGTMLLKMSLAILVLVGPIALLTLLKPREIAVATAAISAIMVCFAGLIAVTALASDSTKTLTVLIGAFAALVAGVAILSTLDQDKVATVTLGLSALIGMFALLVASTSIMGKSMGGLLILTAIMAILGGILYVLASLPVESTLVVAASLSILLLALSGACLILSVVGATGPAALIGIGSLVVLITAVGGLMIAIGALAQYVPSMEEFLDKGITLLEKIGYGLGSFFGNIIGGFTAGISSGLPEIGANLSNFMDNIQPFIDGAKGIDDSMMSGVKALAETILILTAADVLNGITSWITGGSSLTDFANQLVPFGSGLKEYAVSVNGIDVNSIANSAKAAKGLADVATAIPNSGGLVGLFAGENDMDKFAGQLKSFGEGLKGYSIAVDGINTEAVTTSANAALSLADMASKIPSDGGLFSWFTGNKDLASFANNLRPFGGGLKAFADEVIDINPEGVNASANAALSLSKITTEIESSGGFFNWFTGNKDLVSFADNLRPFGKGLKAYADEVLGINPEGVTASANAALALANITTKIESSGGFFNWFTGNKDLVSFADNLRPFGKGLKAYADEVKDIDPKAVKASTTVIDSLSEMMKTMDGLTTDGATTFKNSVNILAETNVTDFVKAFSGSSEKMVTIGTNISDSIIKGVEAKQTAITKSMTTILDAMTTSIDSKKSKFKDGGTSLMIQFASAIGKSSSKVKTTLGTVLDVAVTKIRSYHDNFYRAGSYLVDGFASGISENTYKSTAKANAMANASAKAAKKALDERSPSKVFYKIGAFAGRGFVNALSDYTSVSYRAGSSIANSARNGLTDSISRISDVINSDMDTQPTIRPVLDLSDISHGVNRLSSMFGINPSIDLLSRTNSINSMMNKNQNGVNDNLIHEIKDLKKVLGKQTVGNTYTINGITYDDGSNVSDAVKELIRASKVVRRK